MSEAGDETRGRVAVVLVNYKRAADTLAAIESLGRSDHADWHAIVVDNEADDRSRAALRAIQPAATVIGVDGNLGFAGGCNLGIRRALADGCDYVFLLNNDAAVTPTTLSELVGAARACRDRALLGSVVKVAGTGAFQFVGARHGAFGTPEWLAVPPDPTDPAPFETAFILGAALFIPAALFDRLGLLDERYFLDYEDTDLCYRARALGIPSLIVPTSVVLHAVGANLGDVDGPLQMYFMARNELLFLEAHGTGAQRRAAWRRYAWWTTVQLKRDLAARRTLGLGARAKLMGVRDYVLRRFGDCPATIRAYARAERPAQRSSPGAH